MARRGAKSNILLDWIAVSYRTVFVGVLLAGAAVAGGIYYFFFSDFGPKAEAQEAIVRAEARLAEASHHSGDEVLENILSSARSTLEEARSAFRQASFDDARVAAIRSENLSQKAIDRVRGGGDTASAVRFYRLEGDVRVKRVGEFAWEPADRNMTLRVGDQVKTASSASAQLIYFDGTITTVSSESLLEIRELSEDPATKVRKVKEKLTWGELVASTQRKNVEGSFHEVATENVAARTEDAGEFRVRFDRQDQTASFDVFQGRVDVAAEGQRESVAAGERVRADSRGALDAKEALPGVPRLIAPTDQRVFVHDDPAAESTTLSWDKVPGAARYHLQISDRTLFSTPLYDDRRAETSVVIAGVPAGVYFWKVAAVASSGAEGPTSEVRSFRVTSQRIRDTGDTTPPRLEIVEPVQTGPMLIINGRTEPGALLWIDGERVDVHDDGAFYAVVRLRKEGVNEVVLEAQDAAGNKARVTRRALVESY